MRDELINFSTTLIHAFASYKPWQIGLQLIIIGAVVYGAMRFLRGTRGARLLRGIALVLGGLYAIVTLAATELHLYPLEFLFTKFVGIASTAIIVVFQPELRRALMRLGETRLLRGFSSEVHEEIGEVVEAAAYCAKRKIGALIAIERDIGLGGIAESGTRINADITAELLETIFFPNTPLHDLGVVISQGKIAYAGVQFPLAEEGTLERELGSRHRAAVGLSAESDAVIVVVSEQTGDISIAERGVLLRKLTAEALRGMLGELLGIAEKKSKADLREAA